MTHRLVPRIGDEPVDQNPMAFAPVEPEAGSPGDDPIGGEP